ncbi:hypothetical protein [Poseidonibacter ostreae]|uniref:Uncharacterized protein n=1 Tax=Poseidonibacter ostreae TaxID=2654171 RepID=A0A6L4WTK0_9BACT|nr:hypothetical protein [Poseidonibacter ostreae]KAB7889565.1 hypothetical protein GBG19_05780 [Poseidonibacter ostreae]
MLDTYKITLTGRNYWLQSFNLKTQKKKFLQSILNEEITDANITISSIRRKGFGSMFIDFESTNDKTIEENFCDYYEKQYEEQEEEYICMDEDIKFDIDKLFKSELASIIVTPKVLKELEEIPKSKSKKEEENEFTLAMKKLKLKRKALKKRARKAKKELIEAQKERNFILKLRIF